MKESKNDKSAEFFCSAESEIRTIAAATMEAATNSDSKSIHNVPTSDYQNNTPAKELIQNIIRAIRTHMLDEVNVKDYLSCHSASLASKVSNMTGGIITCTISDTIVTLSCRSGVTCSLTIEGKTMNDIRQEIRAILVRYMLHASISPRTRDAIACIIDLEQLADMALIEDLTADTDAPLYSYSLL